MSPLTVYPIGRVANLDDMRVQLNTALAKLNQSMSMITNSGFQKQVVTKDGIVDCRGYCGLTFGYLGRVKCKSVFV